MKFTHLRPITLAVIFAIAVIVSGARQGGQPTAVQAADEKAGAPASGSKQLFSIDHSELKFGQVPLGSKSPVHSVKITSADGSLVNIHSIVAGEDFHLDPPDCNVNAATTCILGVTFAPQSSGPSDTPLTITGTTANAVPYVQHVMLISEGTDRCNAGADFFTTEWFIEIGPVFLVVALFFIGIVVIRWNMVALPNKRLLRSQIEGVRAEVATLTPTPLTPQILPQVTALLDLAEAPFKDKKGGWDQVADYLFWTRGEEIAAWVCIHEAEELMVELLPEDRIKARMERAEQELRRINNAPATTMADRVHEALAPPAGLPPLTPGRCHALLHEALSLIYDKVDSEYTSFMSWQNKAVWLIGCGLLFIVALAAALQHGVLLLVGAVGGLLSRLSRSLQRADVPTDYGASWTTLFLSPVVGALMGWAGVLLIIIGVKLGVLGTAFNKVEWCNPWSPFTLGIAFLMGFSERAFNGILTQLEDKTRAQVKASATTGPSTPSSGATPKPTPTPTPEPNGPAPTPTPAPAPPAPTPGPAPQTAGQAATPQDQAPGTLATDTAPPSAAKPPSQSGPGGAPA